MQRRKRKGLNVKILKPEKNLNEKIKQDKNVPGSNLSPDPPPQCGLRSDRLHC